MIHKEGNASYCTDDRCYRYERRRVLGTLHTQLANRFTWYHNWHHHPHHKKIHGVVAVLHTALMFAVVIANALPAGVLAADNVWNFGVPGDYTVSSASTTEISGSSARLKSQQMTSDANTKALYHFDESSGTATDSSTNANTATLCSGASYAAGKVNNGLSLDGNTSCATAPDSASLSSPTTSITLEAFMKFNGAFDNTDNASMGIIDKGNYKMYFDSTSGKLKFEVDDQAANTWAKVGEDNAGSWENATYSNVRSIKEFSSSLYVGTIGTAGTAEVWRYSGSGMTWTKVGGDGVNTSWNGIDYEGVYSLEVYGGALYAGLGVSVGDAEVWKYDGTSWTKVGGDTLNSGWTSGNETVYKMTADGSYLYAGLGNNPGGDADVWRWNGTVWSQIGGDGLNSSWAASTFETITALTMHGSLLIAGLGITADDAEVWSWNGTAWTKIAGDNLNSGWNTGIEEVSALVSDTTNLYAGTGTTAGDGDVWRWNGTAWTQIGGDGLNSSWAASTIERVWGLEVVGSTVYASLGESAADGQVWSWNGTVWTRIADGAGSNSGWNYSKEFTHVGEFNGSLIVGTGGGSEDNEAWSWNGSAWTQLGGLDWTAWAPAASQRITSMTVNNDKLYISSGGSNKNAHVWQYDGTTWTHVGGNGVNSGWGADMETAASLTTFNGKVYAGLGDSAGDADVWEFNGTNAWSLVGGDAINSSWTAATYERVYSLAVHDDVLYAGLGSGISDAEVWSYNGSTWTKRGGDTLNSSWTGASAVEKMVSDGTYLYASLQASLTQAMGANVWRYDGSAWTNIGGNSVNGSWRLGNIEEVRSSVRYDNKTYVGLGHSTSLNMAQVWEWNGTTWQIIGGSSIKSSWPQNTYETVWSLTSDATYLYAGIGTNADDAEVWRYNGTVWDKIGGDSLNSSWASGYETGQSLSAFGGNLYAGLGATANDGEVWRWNGTTWTQIGGDSLNSGWTTGIEYVWSMANDGANLYVGNGSTAGDGDVWRWNGTSWTQIGGDALNSGWAGSAIEYVASMTYFGSTLYVGTGSSAGDGDVWSWNGTSWTQIGGDNLNSGWASSAIEYAYAMTNDGTNLYVGTGSSVGDADVWRWNGSAWTQLGGDGLNTSWAASTYTFVPTLLWDGTSLLAGLGTGGGNAEVWKFNGSAWSQFGGDDLNSGWTTGYGGVYSMVIHAGKLYVGIGETANEGEVWEWNGTSWTQIGGDNLNSGWVDSDYEQVSSLVSYNGELYAGLGTSAGDGELWKWNGTSWAQIGGDGLNASWTGVIQSVRSMTVYNGKLYTGLGDGGPSLTYGEVWAYGDNKIAASTTASWSAGWYHVAATYNGTSAKIYVDGVEQTSTNFTATLADGASPLYLGSLIGQANPAQPLAATVGMIDEVRISNSARTSFVVAPYSNTSQTAQPTAPSLTSGVKSWDGFSTSETLNGGTITYRLSSDSGTTWKYYTGGAWTASASTSQANAASVINTNIPTFPVGTGGVLWQAILLGDGTQQVTLNSVTLTYTADNTSPTNPNAVAGLNVNGGGTSLTSNNWYNYATPYFSWTGAADTGGSGVQGYFVYFGTDNTADPTTAGAFQVEATYSASSLVNGSTYYLRIKTRDVAQNVSATAYSAFTYKYDATAATNPAFVSVNPSGYTATNNFTFIWPSTGGSAASDDQSGVAGYQYKTGAASGSLSTFSATSGSTEITIPDAAYQEGANTFYLRVIDNAGNASNPITATYYFNETAPTAPQNVIATPTSNTANSFAFSWAAPASFAGNANELTYYYSINTTPTIANVTSAGNATSLAAGAYATQQGTNTFYIVAKDASNNINYDSNASVTFTATTTAPGQPLNLTIADSSNRASNQYRLSLTWEAPTSGGPVHHYSIQRAIDNGSYTAIGTTASTGYIDTDLQTDKTYSYKVFAVESAGATSVASSVVSKKPTGKYTEPPTITTDPSAVAGATSVTITWVTNRPSDAFVEYGATTDYGLSYGQREEKTDHKVTIAGLTPGTIYHYRVQSLDSGDLRDYDSTQGRSADFTFETTAAPGLSNVSFSDITTNAAILSFDTSKAATSIIEYGTSTNYGSVITDESGGGTTKHTLRLKDLADGTTYQLRVSIKDADGNTVSSPGHAFTTLAKPRISNVRFETLLNTAQTTVKVTWSTNVATTGSVRYSSETAPIKEAATSEYKTDHEFVISGLLDQSTYSFQAVSRDKFGNDAVSDTNSVKTPSDSRAPKLENLTVEIRSSGVSTGQKAQLVVSWETDEPASSMIEYGPGISADSYSGRSQEDTALTTSHVIIVSELEPSKLYHLRAVSKDRAGNQGNSADTTAITGKMQRSVVDIILNSLQRSFSFLSKLGK